MEHLNIRGNNPDVFGPVGLQDQFVQLIHPGSDNDYDVLKTHIDDLNGAAAGYLTADNQLSARIDLAHTPEPGTLLLFGSGIMGLVGFRRMKRK